EAYAGSARRARRVRGGPPRRAVTAAFRALPAYRALVEECRRRPECPKDATTGQPEPWRLELRAFRFPGERRIHVTVSLPEAGCAEWGPGMGALFVLDGIRDRTPQLRSWTETELGVPRLMVDVERDGTLELLTSRWTAGADLELLDERGRLRRSWTTVFVGCGC
ncbi:MAG: hypothetical protein OXT09_12240, partial [Myxococcales bacterium]|nr:hypothetical protein [Myxococcales bacterium]